MDEDSFMEILRASVIAVVCIAVFVGWFWLHVSRSRFILRTWAAENGFRIVSSETRYMISTGPFKWWTNSGGQIVYFVKIRDRDGDERSCWVRCGSYLGGVLFSHEAEVRWDES